MWGPILGGFTILGAFLTLSAWINGRSIKRYIGELIREIKELIKEESKASREILAKLSDQHESMLQGFKEITKAMEAKKK